MVTWNSPILVMLMCEYDLLIARCMCVINPYK